MTRGRPGRSGLGRFSPGPLGPGRLDPGLLAPGRRAPSGHRAARPPHVRDSRAVLWPAPAGSASVRGPAPRVAVVGGGIAGLAAATALAERGVRVELLERHATLGGRLRGWRTRLADGSTVTMSRGFHAFFRQYYNLRSLLARTGGAGLPGTLVPLPDYPLQRSGGTRDSFRRVPRTPPWSVLGFVARSPSFTLSGMAGMNPREALCLLDVRVPQVYERLDGVSAADFLDRVNFPLPARDLAFEVFSRSFFADPRELSAAELVLMFHIYFLGSAEGLLFDVPAEPFPAALWDPLAQRLDGLGVPVRTGVRVRSVEPYAGRTGDGFALHLDPGTGEGRGQDGSRDQGWSQGPALDQGRHGTPETDRYDAVVLALDSGGLRDLVAASPGLCDGPWRERVAALRQAPPFLVSRYWLDRPVAAGRPGFLGTSGYGPLDNVSVLDRWEGEAARWSARTGGSVVEAHAYALPRDGDRRAAEARLHREVARVYPETARAGVVDARHEWHDDCPHFPVGEYAARPDVRTPHPGLVLAGDLVRTPLPVALMERAATTGFQAANALLATWGVRGHPLWSVPVGGRSALLRRLGALGR
ncbi:isorenieratene synthase [Streptomyces sp. Amel2xB2]|uniref:FAD-dependent oxidoreductase n=1 Tax=Streptomyces sp. Amel2xB2 TaxID=1305829 RepID=UPI000DBA0A6F|nr:FAD-dependent oxidoreductase [Streptomyces sp. Amel2xB2]RAJ66453.1 isorenieratene synthase [Streptomyces sp. Amel2xB2]